MLCKNAIYYGQSSNEIEVFQEFLNWFALKVFFNTIKIDGVWGDKTQALYSRFLKYNGLVHSQKLYKEACQILIKPYSDLLNIYTMAPRYDNFDLQLVVIADYIYKRKPIEVIRPQDSIINNGGQYVKWLFDLTDATWDNALEGNQWAHCAAFVIKCLQITESLTGIKSPINITANNWRVPNLAKEAKEKNLFVRGHANVKIKPGDLVLYRKSNGSWRHTGIIYDTDNIKNGNVVSMESNTCGGKICQTLKKRNLILNSGLYDYVKIF